MAESFTYKYSPEVSAARLTTLAALGGTFIFSIFTNEVSDVMTAFGGGENREGIWGISHFFNALNDAHTWAVTEAGEHLVEPGFQSELLVNGGISLALAPVMYMGKVRLIRDWRARKERRARQRDQAA